MEVSATSIEVKNPADATEAIDKLCDGNVVLQELATDQAANMLLNPAIVSEKPASTHRLL